VSGAADLVLRAQPRLADINWDVTEGRTWRLDITDINDAAGDPVDLTSATVVCKVITDVDGGDVLTLDTTGGLGTLTVSATSTATAALATGATKNQPRQCLWYCKVTSGANVIQFWGPTGSNVRIFPEA
jgi:hypothetical protein